MTSVLTRRTVLKTAALASTAIAAPFVRGAFAAGKLSCGFWDHWVPTATAPLEQLCREWAAKEKVDITVDFITSNGDKDLLTMAAEAQAKSGHDVLQFTSWYATGQALCHGHNIRYHIIVFPAEKLSRAAHACLYLIADHHQVLLITPLAHTL